jgi:hypothetical protein
MKSTSPLIKGFCRAVHPDFDTKALVSPMKPDFTAIAARYAVHPRTIRRWHAAGVQITDPQAVGRHLADQKRPSIAAIRASLQILNSNP